MVKKKRWDLRAGPEFILPLITINKKDCVDFKQKKENLNKTLNIINLTFFLNF